MREALLSLMEEVRALRSELDQARTEMRDLKTLADTDPLLGVLNPARFCGGVEPNTGVNRALQCPGQFDLH